MTVRFTFLVSCTTFLSVYGIMSKNKARTRDAYPQGRQDIRTSPRRRRPSCLRVQRYGDFSIPPKLSATFFEILSILPVFDEKKPGERQKAWEKWEFREARDSCYHNIIYARVRGTGKRPLTEERALVGGGACSCQRKSTLLWKTLPLALLATGYRDECWQEREKKKRKFSCLREKRYICSAERIA